MKKILIPSLLISILNGSLQAAEAAKPQKRPHCESLPLKEGSILLKEGFTLLKEGSILWYINTAKPDKNAQGEKINPFPLQTKTVDGENHVTLELNDITSLEGLLFIKNIRTVTHIKTNRGTTFEDIPEDSFNKLENLTSLTLNLSLQLKTIRPGAFAGLKNLTTLDLSYCTRLKTINPKDLTNLLNLRSLNLKMCYQLQITKELEDAFAVLRENGCEVILP